MIEAQNNNSVQSQDGNSSKPLLPAVLSKLDAIKAMREGKKVTHRYFSDNEWMTITPTGLYQFEDGVVCPTLLFWQDRKGKEWETDWSVYSR